jgi:hypothetical protein
VERTYNADVAAVLLLTDDMLRLGSRGIFTLRFPDHPWTRAVADLAARLVS